MNIQDLPHQKACAQWSNRIILLSLLGIAYLTLFPFRFEFTPTVVFHRYPFLLASSVKQIDFVDFFLNVLLFVPLGFGLAALARKRGIGRWASLLLALAVGAAVSYTVEVSQFYIPERDSGWMDEVSNSTGSVVGFFLFELFGGALLEELSRWESSIAGWLTTRRAALLLLIFFAACFGASAHWQAKTRLSDWDPQALLFIGNDATGHAPWRGQVSRLEIWDRALPEQAAGWMAGGSSANGVSTGLLGSYDFTSGPPYRDKRNFLPALVWTAQQPQLAHAGAIALDGNSWLRTETAVENLNREIGKSNQFTVHVVCAPAATVEYGRIVSLSRSADSVNFNLRQEGTSLVLWFLNPLTNTGSSLAWYIPAALQMGKTRDIVATYDGSDAFLYLEGNRVPQTYRLGPGTGLVRRFHWVQTDDLEGCVIVYHTLVFMPVGFLIGIVARKWSLLKISDRWILAIGWALPAVLLEMFLSGMSGRRIWPANIVLSLVFGLAGMLLVNADRGNRTSRTGFSLSLLLG